MADGKPPARNSYHSFAAKPLRNEVNMERLAKIYRENENFRLILKLFFILLMSRLFMLVLMVIYNVYMGTDRSIAFLISTVAVIIIFSRVSFLIIRPRLYISLLI